MSPHDGTSTGFEVAIMATVRTFFIVYIPDVGFQVIETGSEVPALGAGVKVVDFGHVNCQVPLGPRSVVALGALKRFHRFVNFELVSFHLAEPKTTKRTLRAYQRLLTVYLLGMFPGRFFALRKVGAMRASKGPQLHVNGAHVHFQRVLPSCREVAFFTFERL